jgi:hypothetical protein
MVRSAAIRRSSTASEQSLLRSFSAIRRPLTDSAIGSSSGEGGGDRDRLDTCRGFRRRSKAVRSKNIVRGDRRGCHSPTGVIPGPAHESAVVPASETGTRAYHKGWKESTGAPPIATPVLPPLPFPQSSAKKESQHKGLRQDYELGETLRHPSHTVVEPTDGRACRGVSSLDNYDFAFVKRSDGSFSYAILAYRSLEVVERGDEKSVEECMTFVMSGAGNTKKVRKRHWDKYVRLVSLDVLSDRPPIDVISFHPQMDDECSMISNVSDQARASRGRHAELPRDQRFI